MAAETSPPARPGPAQSLSSFDFSLSPQDQVRLLSTHITAIAKTIPNVEPRLLSIALEFAQQYGKIERYLEAKEAFNEATAAMEAILALLKYFSSLPDEKAFFDSLPSASTLLPTPSLTPTESATPTGNISSGQASPSKAGSRRETDSKSNGSDTKPTESNDTKAPLQKSDSQLSGSDSTVSIEERLRPLEVTMRLLMIFSRAVSNHRIFENENGIQMTINVLAKFQGHPVILEQACRALVNIATTERNRKRIAAEGGIEKILNIMKRYKEHQRVQEATCWALRNLAVNDANKKAIESSGGVELLVLSMQTHPNDGAVQEQACWALENLSLRDPELSSHIAKSGGVDCLINALITFPDRRKLQEAACWAVANLNKNDELHEIISSNRKLQDALRAAKRTFVDLSALQEHVASVLDSIVNLEEPEGPTSPRPLLRKPQSTVILPAMLSASTLYMSGDPPSEGGSAPALNGSSKLSLASPIPEGDEDEEDETLNVPPPPRNAIVKEGYLVKQGGKFKTWRKRWFILTQERLSYFKDEKSKVALGVIDAARCLDLSDDPNRKFGITVSIPNRTYRIVCPTKEDAVQWLQTIRSSWLGARQCAMGERIRAEDVEGFLIHKLFSILPESVKHMELIWGTSIDAQLIEARLARVLSQAIISKRLETCYIIEPGIPKGSLLDGGSLTRMLLDHLDICVESVLTEVKNGKLKPYHLKHRFHSAETRGVRPKMEDITVLHPHARELFGINAKAPISYYAIFDGHGGNDTAVYAGQQLHFKLFRSEQFLSGDIPEAIRVAYRNTNEGFRDGVLRQVFSLTAGSTGLVALIYDNVLYVSWVGDSLGYLYKDGNRIVECVVPHKPNSATERKRIEDRGGFVDNVAGVPRVNGALAVSRALGDLRFTCVDAEPDVIALPLVGDEKYLILGCDGLWDVVQPDELGVIVEDYRSSHNGSMDGIAEYLVQKALELESFDNVSVVVLEFEK